MSKLTWEDYAKRVEEAQKDSKKIKDSHVRDQLLNLPYYDHLKNYVFSKGITPQEFDKISRVFDQICAERDSYYQKLREEIDIQKEINKRIEKELESAYEKMVEAKAELRLIQRNQGE